MDDNVSGGNLSGDALSPLGTGSGNNVDWQARATDLDNKLKTAQRELKVTRDQYNDLNGNEGRASLRLKDIEETAKASGASYQQQLAEATTALKTAEKRVAELTEVNTSLDSSNKTFQAKEGIRKVVSEVAKQTGSPALNDWFEAGDLPDLSNLDEAQRVARLTEIAGRIKGIKVTAAQELMEGTTPLPPAGGQVAAEPSSDELMRQMYSGQNMPGSPEYENLLKQYMTAKTREANAK